MEKHPSTAVGYETREERTYTPGQGTTEVTVYEGDAAEIRALEVSTKARIDAGAIQNVASVTVREARGRASMDVQYSKLIAGVETDEGTQELYGVDVMRDIALAPYFAGLTNAQIADVMRVWDEKLTATPAGWTATQSMLYGHIAHGQDSYNETAYELRITRNVTGSRALRLAASNPNTVQPLPGLHNSLRLLISSLPAGEWLKKPITVTSAGRRGWTVAEQYQWAPQWSVIYGGTFTGLDA